MTTPPKGTKVPQDHKSKAPSRYSFTGADGVERELPLASEGAELVPGRITRDVVMNPNDQEAQIRLAFALLDACGTDDETREAFYDLPTGEMVTHLRNWSEFGDGDGASVPQS